jgi:methylase of polypeptide subunit release factors
MDPKTRKKLGAFYTSELLAAELATHALRGHDFEPAAVIDLACGEGSLLEAAREELAKRGWQATPLIGYDINPSAIEIARSRLPEARLEVADSLWASLYFPPGRVAFIMNPPFLGGGKISGTIGKEYQQRLMDKFDASHGNADLCISFLRRAEELATPGSTISIIATNTISQGDSRSMGLAWMLARDWIIYEAYKSLSWPGDAKVSISIVHLQRAMKSHIQNVLERYVGQESLGEYRERQEEIAELRCKSCANNPNCNESCYNSSEWTGDFPEFKAQQWPRFKPTAFALRKARGHRFGVDIDEDECLTKN